MRATDGPILNPGTDIVLLLTRLNGPVFAVNPDLIERAEETPDTVITLVNGSRYVIHESLAEFTALMRTYRADMMGASQGFSAGATSPRPSLGQRHIGRAPGRSATVVALRPGKV